MTFIRGIGTPNTKGAGYYRNDDTASGGSKVEADIKTCSHCQAIIKLQTWKEQGNFCNRCMAPICERCGIEMDTLGCVPFLKRLEQQVDSIVKYRQYLKVAGLEPGAAPQQSPGILISRS
jgi:hypothetical protein